MHNLKLINEIFIYRPAAQLINKLFIKRNVVILETGLRVRNEVFLSN